MRALYPAGEVDLEAAYTIGRGRVGNRPRVVVSMVVSADGATSLDGVSGTLGNPTDQSIFLSLRRQASVVLVGAATVRAERYRPLRDPAKLLAVVTGTGDLGAAEGLADAANTILVTTEAAPVVSARVVRAGRGKVDLAEALSRLPGDLVVAEGGSTLNAQLLAEGLVDEVCVTVAPRFVGGRSPRFAVGENADSSPWTLVHLLEEDGFLFARYAR